MLARPRRRIERRSLVVVTLVVAALALAGCGGSSKKDDGEPAPIKASATSGQPAADAVRVTFSGASVSPTGGEAKVKVNQPLKLYITADKAGEIHVHSTPEQHIEYPKGTSTAELTFDKPGVIEVESHSLDKQILQVEVR